jgi:hypothetical protein
VAEIYLLEIKEQRIELFDDSSSNMSLVVQKKTKAIFTVENDEDYTHSCERIMHSVEKD